MKNFLKLVKGNLAYYAMKLVSCLTTLLKSYKEELLSTIFLVLGFYYLNAWLLSKYPGGTYFEFSSMMETIFYRLVSVVICFVFSWAALRITFPQVYTYLREEFYHNFKELDAEIKRKYAVHIFLVFVLCVALVSRSVGGNTSEIRSQLIKRLDTQLNIRETSPNRGPEVDVFLKSVGTKPPAPWCGAYVGYNLSYFKVPNPNSAWSPAYADPKNIIWQPKRLKKISPLPGDVFTLYYSSLKRVGHVGFFIGLDQSGYFIIQAGNTNSGGSREGQGVGRKKIEPGKIHAISRYIKP